MKYSEPQVSDATAVMEKYRASQDGEIGAALVVVGLSAEKAANESQIRDDMIRVAHRDGPLFASSPTSQASVGRP
jgi:hypothetical protein